jgi:glucose/arabinose dehydrogenase
VAQEYCFSPAIHAALKRCATTAACALLALSILGCKSPPGQPPAEPPPPGNSNANTITLNPAVTLQTMVGWEVPVISTVLDYAGIVPFMGPLMDQAANDLGINKIAIGMESGDENPSGACQVDYLNRAISEGTLVNTCLYNSVNDNNDPFVVNPNGFHFTLLDWQIDNLLLPLKQRVEARGEKLHIMIRYVDFRATPFEHFQNPEEYAELMQVVFDHINTKYGFVPDAIDVVNEPENSPGWSPNALGRVIASAGARLAARGWRPDFVGPSTVNKGNAAPYFDAMMATPGAAPFLKDLAWHCYSDSGSNSSAAIAARATQFGVRTSMTECWNTSNTYLTLHQELKASRNASWQLGTVAGINGYYDVSGSGQITLRPKARFIRQYFKHVRAGARRIDATSPSASFDPVAFINTDGRYVVVVKATGGGSFSVANLPAATYGIFYTTGPDGLNVTNFDVNLGDQTVAAGRTLTTSIPSTGVITIYAKTRSTAADTNGSAASLSSDPRSDSAERTTRSTLGAQWPADAEITTTDGVRLRLEKIPGRVLDPIDIAPAPDGRLFVAERGGLVLVVRDGQLLEEPALSLDEHGDAPEEFLALAVDPAFDRNHYVYAVSTTGPERGRPASIRLARFREAWNTLGDRIILLDGIGSAGSGAAASLRFGPDGKLFAAFDDGGVPSVAEDFASPNGKVLRLNPDGSTPDDQAFGNPLFSFPYHSPRGFDWYPPTHTLWVADRDSQGSTRISVVTTGQGRQKRGEVRGTLTLPSSSPASAVAFYRDGPNRALRDNLFVASNEGRHMLRLQLDPGEPLRVLSTERLLDNQIGGIRVVAVGSDGAIYVGTATLLARLVPHQ